MLLNFYQYIVMILETNLVYYFPTSTQDNNLIRALTQCHVHITDFRNYNTIHFFGNKGSFNFFYASSEAATSAPLLSFILNQLLLPHFFPMLFSTHVWTFKSHAPTSFPSLTSFLIPLFIHINLTSFCPLYPYHSLSGNSSLY